MYLLVLAFFCGGTNPSKIINGNGGNDTITGADLADTINGGDGNETLTGGTGDDSLNGGLGIDTISGSAGEDTLVGASNDGSQDSLDGGLGIDTCQGPAPDPDIHANCENTSVPPTAGPDSGAANAAELCRASRGRRGRSNAETLACPTTWRGWRRVCTGAVGAAPRARGSAPRCVSGAHERRSRSGWTPPSVRRDDLLLPLTSHDVDLEEVQLVSVTDRAPGDLRRRAGSHHGGAGRPSRQRPRR